MIDQNNRHPHEAVITAAFFAFGHIFQWLGEPTNMAILKDSLSIVSFSISIIVGIRSLMKKQKKQS